MTAETRARHFFIIWNKARNEAFVTDREDDAESVASGRPHYGQGYASMSTVGEAFHEAYGDEGLAVETLDLPAAQAEAWRPIAPSGELLRQMRMLNDLLVAEIARDGETESFMIRAGLLRDILALVLPPEPTEGKKP